MLLRVMARDQLNVSIDYTYSSTTVDNSSANGLSTLVTSIASMILNSSAVTSGIKTEAAAIASSEQASTNVDNFFSPEGASGTTTGVPPKAYLHILLFNDQFVFDNVNSVVVPITTAGLNTRATVPAQIVTAARCGYAYVYFSNESNTTVYFDNFALTDVRGPVLETNAYYPFGLTMSAISDKAIKTTYAENKYRYNKGSELQNKEFSDGSGLEMYETHYRTLDPQLGRFWQIDPKPDPDFSPYTSMGNNPISHTDALGDTLLFPSASAEFQEQFEQATTYLEASGVGDIYQTAMFNNTFSASVLQTDGISKYDPGTNTLLWNPNGGLTAFRGESDLSPTTVLNHELDHLVQANLKPNQFQKDSNTPVAGYEDKEEERVIKGTEQKTAEALGEVKKGEPTRTNHLGYPHKTFGPTTNKTEKQVIEELKTDKVNKSKNATGIDPFHPFNGHCCGFDVPKELPNTISNIQNEN